MSLVLIDRRHDVWNPGQHTGTFRGNNLAFVAARALLEYWETDAFANRVVAHGQLMAAKLQQLAAHYGEQAFAVRGRGMVWGLDVKDGQLAGRISQLAFQHGLIVETAGCQNQVVKLLPPLTTERADLERGFTVLGTAIRQAVEEKQIATPVPPTANLPAIVPSHVH